MVVASVARPWLQHYPDNVPANIDLAKVTSLASLINDAVLVYGNRKAFESFGKAITFTELGRAARKGSGRLAV